MQQTLLYISLPLLVSLAFFAPAGGGGGRAGVLPCISYIGMRGAKGYVFFFYPFCSEIGYQFRPFWSEIGYGLCTLVLNWVCFLNFHCMQIGLVISMRFIFGDD